MTGQVSDRPRPADLLSRGGTEPLPVRPQPTTPPHLQHQAFADLQRQRLAAQPWLGLGGLLLGAAVFFALALGTGSTDDLAADPRPDLDVRAARRRHDRVLVERLARRPAHPALDRPDRHRPGRRRLGRADHRRARPSSSGPTCVEYSRPAPDRACPVTFPATLALAGAAFTAMLQLSLVCERWPLAGIGRLRSGDRRARTVLGDRDRRLLPVRQPRRVPAAERGRRRAAQPRRPIAGPDFGSALIAVGVWQAVFFIALRGWPVNTITRRPHRLLAGNALVAGLGALTYLVLRNLAHWQPDAISAACGCVISAALIVAMLFEGWPAARLPPAPGRVLTLALTALVALALDRALAAYAGSADSLFVDGDSNYRKVADHDEVTAYYCGAARDLCNRKRQVVYDLPGFLHNFRSYDTRLIVRVSPSTRTDRFSRSLRTSCDPYKSSLETTSSFATWCNS